MKFNKLLAICKKSGEFLLHNGNECQWLGDSLCLFPLYDHPTYDSETIANVASLTSKQKDKTIIQVRELKNDSIFADAVDDESYCEMYDVAIQFRDGVYKAISTKDGVRFINARYLAPLSDEEYELYERDYLNYKFIVAKIGFVVNAVFIVTEHHITAEDAQLLSHLSCEISNALSLIVAKQNSQNEEDQYVFEAEEKDC